VPIYRQEADENVNRAMTRMNGQPRVFVCDSESQSLRALKIVLCAVDDEEQMVLALGGRPTTTC
jgi:hypothetical protein